MCATSNLAAAELRHLVGEDESLDSIAKNYYGSSWKSVYLQVRNNLDPNATLTGERVYIPASWTYKVRRGDSVAAIAKRYMGDANRHVAIMEFNNIKSPSDLAVGQDLLMPFHLFHQVKPGETLAQISRRFYRTPRRASTLKSYNNLGVLKAGERLAIPIFDSATVDVRSRRYNPASSDPIPDVPTPVATLFSQDEARARLNAAMTEYYAGAFGQACDNLEALLGTNVLTGTDSIELIKYLGFCAVASDDAAAARDYFRKWIELQPNASLDPVRTSPKILAVFQEVMSEAPKPGGDTNGESPQDGSP